MTAPDYDLIFAASPAPTLCLDAADKVVAVNTAAEQLLSASADTLTGRPFAPYAPAGSRAAALIAQARAQRITVRDYDVEFTLENAPPKSVDLLAAPLTDGCPETVGAAHDEGILLVIQPRSLAERIDKSLAYRGGARSISALSATLAHEIRNPLAAISGAAQLFEMAGDAETAELARLIIDESDRIKRLVDRFELFTDTRPTARRAVNIHDVLTTCRLAAGAGYGVETHFIELYDPSLPPTPGDRDQLVQAFTNLIKNAVEAAGPQGRVTLTTAYRPGVRLASIGGAASESLPLEVLVIDDGPGAPPDLQSQIFEPFVSTKAAGAGLGLPLVAKVIADHGGVVDLDSRPGRTCFRVLLPVWSGPSEATS